MVAPKFDGEIHVLIGHPLCLCVLIHVKSSRKETVNAWKMMRRREVPGSSVQLGVQKLSSQDQTSTPCDPPDSPGIGMDPKRGSNWLLASKWFRFGRKLGRDGKP